MLLTLLQLIFCMMPLVLPLALYRKPYRFMAKFHAAMTHNAKARKLYTRVLLFLLFLFHYAYASGHIGEPGIWVSTGICAALFPFRLADRWLCRLHGRPVVFAGIAAVTLAICFEPHLYTTAVTASYLLLAALFYPSVPVTAQCGNEGKIDGHAECPGALSKGNHDNHHAMLPDEADNGSIHESPHYNNHKTKWQ